MVKPSPKATRPPAPANSAEHSTSSLYRELQLLRQDFDHHAQLYADQFGRLEKVLAIEHEVATKQFATINEQLGQLVKVSRVEIIESKVNALERRNDRLDGAAVAAKGLWFVIGGLIVGLLVAWLK